MYKKIALLLCLTLSFPMITDCGKKTETFVPSIGVILLPSPVEIHLGETKQFEATVANSDSKVEWSVEGGDVNGTIDATGLYTAPQVLPDLGPDGAIIIRGKLEKDLTVQGTAEVHLIP